MENHFSSNLIRLRSERNLTQQELADAVGITPSQISRYESGLARPRKTVLLRLAEALGVTVPELEGKRRMQVVVGAKKSVPGDGSLRNRMLTDLAKYDSDESAKARQEAKEAGVPYEEYVTARAEATFIAVIKRAVEDGDMDTATAHLALAGLLFGTNIKIVDEEEGH